MKNHHHFLDELPQHKPKRIDVYVDGSLLYESKSNPAAASGWGAVIVERCGDHDLRWTPSAPIIPVAASATEAEVIGALRALQAIRTREYYRPEDQKPPEIALHSDTRFEKLPARINHLSELKALIGVMDVKVKHKSHDKSVDFKTGKASNDEMAQAHFLANRTAWAERLRLQNGIENPGRTMH